MTYSDLIEDSAPFWFDMLTIVFLWLAALVNGYLAIMRVTHPHGLFAVARTVAALGMLILAVRFTWWVVMYGDLLISAWASSGILFICVGSTVLGVDRMKNGRGSKE